MHKNTHLFFTTENNLKYGSAKAFCFTEITFSVIWPGSELK